MLLPDATIPPKTEPFHPVSIPYLETVPGAGDALFTQTPAHLSRLLRRRRSAMSSFASRSASPCVWSAKIPSPLKPKASTCCDPHGCRHDRQRLNGRRWRLHHHVLVRRPLLQHDQLSRLYLRGVVTFAAWRPGKALLGTLIFGRTSSPPSPRPADGRGRHPVPILSDAALSPLHSGDDRDGEAGDLSEGAAFAVQAGG